MIYELSGSAFNFFEDTFDGGALAVGGVIENEPPTVERAVESWRAIDEKHGVANGVFRQEFAEKASINAMVRAG